MAMFYPRQSGSFRVTTENYNLPVVEMRRFRLLLNLNNKTECGWKDISKSVQSLKYPIVQIDSQMFSKYYII